MLLPHMYHHYLSKVSSDSPTKHVNIQVFLYRLTFSHFQCLRILTSHVTCFRYLNVGQAAIWHSLAYLLLVECHKPQTFPTTSPVSETVIASLTLHQTSLHHQISHHLSHRATLLEHRHIHRHHSNGNHNTI